MPIAGYLLFNLEEVLKIWLEIMKHK